MDTVGTPTIKIYQTAQKIYSANVLNSSTSLHSFSIIDATITGGLKTNIKNKKLSDPRLTFTRSII